MESETYLIFTLAPHYDRMQINWTGLTIKFIPLMICTLVLGGGLALPGNKKTSQTSRLAAIYIRTIKFKVV